MPTESTFLFAGLLFVAAALGYVFARFGDTDEEEEAARSARARFLRGFRYLLNEESDRAVDTFTGAGDQSDEAMETQMALGTLFRRRGEMDRAIRLHQNLLDRPSSSDAQRELASFALAEDYLSAGLFDRAEDLFLRLRSSSVHGVEAVRRLLRIAEVTSDWDRAVDLGAELGRLAPGSMTPGQLAHYYCELAEAARRNHALDQARLQLAQAEATEPGKTRTSLIRSDLEADAGQYEKAAALLTGLAASHHEMLNEILPRLLNSPGLTGYRGRYGPALAELAATPEGLRAIAMAVIRDPQITDALAVSYLRRYIEQQPLLHALAPSAQPDALERLREVLHRISRAGARYQCANCGYESAVLHWQCPGCRAWDSLRRTREAVLDGVLS